MLMKYNYYNSEGASKTYTNILDDGEGLHAPHCLYFR